MSGRYEGSRGRYTRSNKALIVLCSILGCFTIILIGLLVYMFILSGKDGGMLSPYKDVYKEIIVEAGTKEVQAGAFLKHPDGSEISFIDSISEEKLQVPGKHTVSLKWKQKVYYCVVQVVDTVAPAGKTRDVVSNGTIPQASAFVTDIVDATAVTVQYKVKPNLTEGDQTVTLVLTDAAGNTNELNATLTIVFDNQAPEIHGVRPIVIYLGDAVSYRAGVSVQDNEDPMPKLSVDTSKVRLDQVGIYPVIYSVVDRAGNETKVETTIEVRERKAGYVEVETIYAAVDAVLEQIIYDGLTMEQQVRAIYAWAKANCVYADDSDKTDYMQEAYRMLTDLRGDCFSFFSISKLMFDRLGIPNIDVRKVKNYPEDLDHYWSMVSLDDGMTWYHFDCTPINDAPNMCLVTDAFLDAFSETHDDFYNRDKDLYPHTPEK